MAIKIGGDIVIDNSKNVVNVASGTFSGKVTTGATSSSDSDTTLATKGYVDPGAAKAWANFDGTNMNIRSSYNVSSITDVNSGRYRVNFSVGMGNGNYAALAFCSKDNTDDDANFDFSVGAVGNGPNASYVPCTYNSNGFKDTWAVYVAVFANL